MMRTEMVRTHKRDHKGSVLTRSQAPEASVHTLFPGKLGECLLVD